MDSSIRLSYSTLPAAPPPRRSTPSASRVHLSLSHVGSLCLSHCPKVHLMSRPLHVKCMLDRLLLSEGSSKNHEEEEEDENKVKIVRGMRGVSLVLACVLGAFSLSSKMNPKSHMAYARWPWSDNAHETQNECSGAPSLADVKKLKSNAISVNDIKKLEKEYEKWKKCSESRHFLEMALIELLLIQGKYDDARRLIDSCINGLLGKDEDTSKLSDDEKVKRLVNSPFSLCPPEIFVYKALVEMKNEKGNAKIWLDGFEEKNSQTSPSDVMPKRS